MCSSSGGQNLHYTASGIITPIGDRLVHGLREDSLSTREINIRRCSVSKTSNVMPLVSGNSPTFRRNPQTTSAIHKKLPIPEDFVAVTAVRTPNVELQIQTTHSITWLSFISTKNQTYEHHRMAVINSSECMYFTLYHNVELCRGRDKNV